MQIYYFTRSGRSKTIAEQLAARFGVHAERIEDGISWAGPWSYMKAGYMAVKSKTLPITYKKPVEGEQIVLVFPIWAGSFPPAVRTFLGEVGRENITCIPTSLGSTLKDRAGFAKVIDLVGDPISAPEEL
ncbi:MAG: flavodoxin [Intestinibacillus sp.]